jgi:DnaJ-class molecular chaperone
MIGLGLAFVRTTRLKTDAAIYSIENAVLGVQKEWNKVKQCLFCNGTGSVPKTKDQWPKCVGIFVPYQIDGMADKKRMCPKCYGKGFK